MGKGYFLFDLYRTLWKYANGRKPLVLLSYGMYVIKNFINLIEPWVIGQVFNTIQFDLGKPEFLTTLFMYLFAYLFITLGVWAFHGPARVIERMNGYYIKRNYQLDITKKVFALPASWHRDHHSGDTIDKVNRASGSVDNFCSNNFIVFDMVFRFLGSIAVLVYLDVISGILAFICAVSSLYIVNVFDKKLKNHFIGINKMFNHLASGIHDFISNVFTVITLRMSSKSIQEIDKRIKKVIPALKRAQIINEVKWFFSSFGITFMTFVVLMYWTYTEYSTNGMIVTGTLYMVYGYMQRIGQTFFQFAFRYGDMVKQHADIVSAQPLFDAYDEMIQYPSKKLPSDWKKIEISNVMFGYGTKKGEHINNISLQIQKGKNIAFIGSSGSGKSTLMSLMRGLYHAEDYSMLLNNKPLNKGFSYINGSSALIPQDPEIFNATVEENITMGIKTPHKKIKEVLKLSRFNQVMKTLPNGLQTNVMEKGVSLSGGEKQRLALARGLLTAEQSDILLLDEPTSSVDSVNETKIYEQILKKYKQKSIISSIHKLNLLHMFDYVYYFKGGRVVAEGSFKQIIANKEFKPVWKKFREKH